MELSDPIETISGIGPKLSEAYKAKGIDTINDLLLYLPRRYDDFSHILPIKNIRPGQISIKAKISNAKTRRGRRGLSITEALASDTTDSVRLVWFNQPYRQHSLKADAVYFISGTYKLSNRQYSIINPSVELADDVPINSARILPIYPESKNLNSNHIRRSISRVINLAHNIPDPMPEAIIEKVGLMHYDEAVKQIHLPDSSESLDSATMRFRFDGLFPLLLANELNNQSRLEQKSLRVPFQVDLARSFVDQLPFKLTDDQRRVIWQIYQDMESDRPMNRLVEGDVGSGKTVVAVMAAVMAMAEGFKVAFMAPTELLAKQHAKTIAKLLEPLKMEEKLYLLTGSMSSKERSQVINSANKANDCFVVGTHSLLTCGIDWHNLALIIIDEQHRFGVDQRTELQKQAGHLPHFLSITATPIPRSLALTVLSDLDLSRLKSMPEKRKPIKTELVAPSDMSRFVDRLKTELDKGRQIYIVCPYIHAKIDEKLALETVFEDFKKRLSKYQIGFIHGQLPSDEQEKVMRSFVANETQVLVATTVIEVGVDVPNASVMVIYGPERFGLAQLHQLRGRVGRGEYESFCFLMLSDANEPLPRLRQFARIQDGFELSELDLSLRGPGAIYGKLQHGKGASVMLTLDDAELVAKTKQAVDLFFKKDEKLIRYKELARLVGQARQLTYLN